MRGKAFRQISMLTSTTPEDLIPADHPIRRIKAIVEPILAELSPTFDAMYAEGGRHSIPPERLLKGCLLIAFYSVRSERQFCERLQYDLLFKWLAFALFLKFFELEGRFPRHAGELPRTAVVYRAEQVHVDAAVLSDVDWFGRTAEYHRAQIRTALGFRKCTVEDGEQLATWLAEDGSVSTSESGQFRRAPSRRAGRRNCKIEVTCAGLQRRSKPVTAFEPTVRA